MNAERLLERLRAELGGNPAVVSTADSSRHTRIYRVRTDTMALVCKVDDAFVLIVLPADRKLASKRVRQSAGAKSLRFATREEVAERTGLAPGSIPPFGSLFGLPTWCDSGLTNESRINFNAGDHAISISMPLADFIRVEQPRLGEFAE